jgi:hypothetical protein
MRVRMRAALNAFDYFTLGFARAFRAFARC